MLIIRREQMIALAESNKRRFLTNQASLLFPSASRHEKDDIVASLERIATRVRQYGLEEYQDLAFFFRLAAARGWEFETAEEAAWMRDILNDPQVTSPSRRLARLATKLEAADERERKNAEVRKQFFERLGQREAPGQ
jgi:hypothetical protein